MMSVYIVGDYNPELKTLAELRLLTTAQAELVHGWADGKTITVSGKDYLLFDRKIMKDNMVIYALILRN